jgi:hypothetical protein
MISAVRAACGLIVCGLLLVACAGAGTSDKPLVISPGTNVFFQAYLSSTSSRSAFAVSEDGSASFYSYCGLGTCNGLSNIGQEAIKGCEQLGQGRCVVLGSNGIVKRPYVVAGGLPALPSQGVRTDFVSGDRIREELVGNSIVEANLEGNTWVEYFAPDGTLRGRTGSTDPGRSTAILCASTITALRATGAGSSPRAPTARSTITKMGNSVRRFPARSCKRAIRRTFDRHATVECDAGHNSVVRPPT